MRRRIGTTIATIVVALGLGIGWATAQGSNPPIAVSGNDANLTIEASAATQGVTATSRSTDEWVRVSIVGLSSSQKVTIDVVAEAGYCIDSTTSFGYECLVPADGFTHVPAYLNTLDYSAHQADVDGAAQVENVHYYSGFLAGNEAVGDSLYEVGETYEMAAPTLLAGNSTWEASVTVRGVDVDVKVVS